MAFVVAIDGPAGSGKGTITKLVAKRLGFITVDTGAMYRCVALECINRNISCDDLAGIEKVLENIEIKFEKDEESQRVFLNGKDVSEAIRTPRVDDVVAKYSAIKIVREKVTPIQRKMGENQDIIMEGRDIGTVVFPNADVKIFLDCSIEERAKRRYKQDLEKNINVTYEEVLESMKKRHKLEVERKVAPFVKAEDAIVVDTTNLTIPEVVDNVEKIVRDKMKANKS